MAKPAFVRPICPGLQDITEADCKIVEKAITARVNSLRQDSARTVVFLS